MWRCGRSDWWGVSRVSRAPEVQPPGGRPQATPSFTGAQRLIHTRALSWLGLACGDLMVMTFSCLFLQVLDCSTLDDGLEMEGDDEEDEDDESRGQGGEEEEEEEE